MSRKFISGILAFGITVTALTAAPARAGDHDDVGRFLGAAATLFIIGKALEHHADGRSNADSIQVHGTRRNHAAPQVGTRNVVTPRRDVNPVRNNGHRSRAALPRQCMIPVSSARTRYVLGQRCLNRNYRAAAHLPQRCRVSFTARNGIRSGYSLRCLRDRGYVIARR